MSDSAPRVRWRERQTLRASDLEVEQAYRVEARRHHQRSHHRSGIVAGLELEVGDDGVTVRPGVAIDGLGRTIVLHHIQTLPLESLTTIFDKLGQDELVLTVAFDETPVERTGGYGPRGLERGYRWSEAPRLDLWAAPPQAPYPPPHQSTGRLVATAAPIALGTLIRLDSDQGFEVHLEPRPKTGLVAQKVLHPEGRVSVEMLRPPDRTRFRVSVGDDRASRTERLAIDRDRKHSVTGDAVAGSRLQLIETSRGSARRVRFGKLKETPEDARPWSLYRTDFQATDNNDQPIGPRRRQLRIEIGAPGEEGDPKRHLFTVGLRGAVRPSLSVDAERTLRLQELVVEGQLVESPIPLDPTDPRFAAAAADYWISGIAAALDQGSALEVAGPEEITPSEDGALSFEIDITNRGAVTLQKVQVYAQLAVSRQLLPLVPVVTIPVLPGSKTQPVAVSLDPPDAGDYSLAVSATAIGPGPIPVSSSYVTTVKVPNVPSTGASNHEQ